MVGSAVNMVGNGNVRVARKHIIYYTLAPKNMVGSARNMVGSVVNMVGSAKNMVGSA